MTDSETDYYTQYAIKDSIKKSKEAFQEKHPDLRGIIKKSILSKDPL
ncbi:MAG: hypothetical protein GY714_19625 [Desulfobacterales bacterium]|nr:hypothetical protein [Desulfobacterales bacterium]